VRGQQAVVNVENEVKFSVLRMSTASAATAGIKIHLITLSRYSGGTSAVSNCDAKLSGPEMRKLLRSLFGSKTLGTTRPSILKELFKFLEILRPRNVSSNPEESESPSVRPDMLSAGCQPRLSAVVPWSDGAW